MANSKTVYKDSNTTVVSLASHKMPEIKEVRGKRWVMFGQDNLYPQYLIDLFNRSSKHNAIITSKSTMIYGKGIDVPAEKVKDYARYINHPNAYEDLNAVTKKLINDYELHGGYAIQVIWGKGSNKISQVAYIDIAKLRVSDCGNYYFYSNDWRKSNPDKEKGFETYNKFNPFEKKGTAVYIKMKHRAGLEQYQLPDYLGAIAAIESDIEVSNWHLNNIKNGFSAGTIINFSNGIPPQSDKQPAIVTQLKRKATGSDKAGEILVNFSDGKDRGVEVVSLQPNNLDKQFLELREHIDREIFVGHKVVSPTIFGVATAGALGQRNEMLDAYEIFTNIYVNPIKKEIEADLNMFANLMGISGNDITLLRLDPVKYQLSEQTLVQVLTVDELRKLAGYEPKIVAPTPTQMSSEIIGYVDKEVLAVIAKQPLIQEADIAKLMGLSADETRNILRRLNTSLLITEQHTATGIEVVRTLTAAGLVVVANLSDDKINEFSQFGVNEDDYEQLEEKFSFATDKELQALSIIKGNDKITIDGLAKALKIEVTEAGSILESLSKQKLIDTKVEKQQDVSVSVRTLTDSANGLLKTNDVTTLETRYRYTVRPELNQAAVINTTRDFCKGLIGLKRLYSREDIDTLSARFGYNVWTQRGGYYHNPTSDVTTPYCRHQWSQVLVKKK